MESGHKLEHSYFLTRRKSGPVVSPKCPPGGIWETNLSHGLVKTQLPLNGEFVYLAVILDSFSQYASPEYVTALDKHGMIASMSRPANPYRNASCESFMKTLKREEIYANRYDNLEQLRMNIEKSGPERLYSAC